MSEIHQGRHIGILLPDLRGGGAERVCLNLANEFAKRNAEVDIVLMRREGELLDQLDPRVRVVDLGASRVRHCLWPLTRYLAQAQPSTLFANMWPLPAVSLTARLLARVRTRIVGVCHTTWSHSELFANPWKRLQIKLSMRALYPNLDGVVAVSKGAADDLSRISGLPGNRITTIYNPIVGAAPSTSNSGTGPDAWAQGTHHKILAVGTLKAIKDYPTLLHGLARLRQTRDARLLILGEGDERSRLEALAVALGLGEAVFMPGFSTNAAPYYAMADLFVLTSTGEGFGNVIVEALEQGTPVVSTDCPSGPREILEDGKYGALVPVGDVGALAQAMEDALTREQDHDALKRRAQDFTIEKAADAYLQLLTGEA